MSVKDFLTGSAHVGITEKQETGVFLGLALFVCMATWSMLLYVNP